MIGLLICRLPFKRGGAFTPGAGAGKPRSVGKAALVRTGGRQRRPGGCAGRPGRSVAGQMLRVLGHSEQNELGVWRLVGDPTRQKTKTKTKKSAPTLDHPRARGDAQVQRLRQEPVGDRKPGEGRALGCGPRSRAR